MSAASFVDVKKWKEKQFVLQNYISPKNTVDCHNSQKQSA